MNQTLVDRIANALLYEGYILYPYRPSLKNRQRWNFGGLVPEAYSLVHKGTDAWEMKTECLVAGREECVLTVTVRFLHPVDRQVGELTPDQAPSFRKVESLDVDGKCYYSWQEAVERTIRLPNTSLGELASQPRITTFHFPHQRSVETIGSMKGQNVGVIVREQQSLEGSVEISAEKVGAGRFKVQVRIRNQTPFANANLGSRDVAILHSLVSTHTILTIDDGDFVSLIDPPEAWRALAEVCRNEGTWPILVGENGAKDTMLSAPIILYDYPQVATESSGDYCDATEIDEMLALRVLTLTPEEKEAMAALDERGRGILQRTQLLAEHQMLGLHGALRKGEPP